MKNTLIEKNYITGHTTNTDSLFLFCKNSLLNMTMTFGQIDDRYKSEDGSVVIIVSNMATFG